MKHQFYLWVSIVVCFFPGVLSVSSKQIVQPCFSEDYDPLVDVEVTVQIQKIRALDKQDFQVFQRSYVDRTSDPDFCVKIIINDVEFVSTIWRDTTYIYEPDFSATLNVPDDQEFVTVKIQLWDWNDDGDVLCDIGNQTDDVTLSYSIKTGRWTGDDRYGDPSGYGRLNGCDDGHIYGGRRDAELWFTIFQNDFDGDSAPYWVEVYEYSTNPEIDDRATDIDHDAVLFSWEHYWGYNPGTAENHQTMDPDHDSLNNIEEYLTFQWGSDPFRKDLFVELDEMAGPDGIRLVFPPEAKELLYTAYNRYNIVYHLDDGSWDQTGSEMVPYQAASNWDDLDMIYYNYFLHGSGDNWRRGVFHYGVLVYNCVVAGGNAFGSNRFQISAKFLEEKAALPLLRRDIVYASAYMHETGHTLGFYPIGGHDENSKYPWQLGWWKWRPYKSCMNYGYMYQMVDYSDGSRPVNDFNDWERMDLIYFERNW
ncbi:MAG: hypothetical protein QXL17_00360 [Candidatus Thermoplasmatota archaeon]